MKKIPVSSKKIQIGFKGLISRTDEGVLDCAYSPYCVNFTFKGGALKSDIGLTQACGYYADDQQARRVYQYFPDDLAVKDIFVYHRRNNGAYDDRLVVQTEQGYIYYTSIFSEDNWHVVAGLVMEGKLSAVSYNHNGSDVCLLSSEEAVFTVLDDKYFRKIPEAPRFSSLAVHHERIFGTVNGNTNQVWFSEDFNPDNWRVGTDGGGYVSFADECGDVLKVISFLNYLYIFREHGIFRLTAFAEQSEFSMKKVFTDTGRIFKATIAPCGDRIIFLAEEGLFSFDGYDVTRIAAELPPLRRAEHAIGAYHDNCYYLACNTLLRTEQENMVNNALIRYDIRDKSIGVLAAVDIAAMAVSNVHHATDLLLTLRSGATYCVAMLDGKGHLFGEPTYKRYESPYNILGSDRLKIVRDITLTTARPVTVGVILDGKVFGFPLKGSPLAQSVFVGRSGRTLGFFIETSERDAHITPMIVNLDLM